MNARDDANTVGDAHYDAEVRRTEHGVAHIRAGDLGSLGFGQAWACASDNLPTIADHLLKTRSERALVYGAGPMGAHLASDFGYLALGVMERGAALAAAQPAEVRALVSGYVAGYNHAVRDAHERGTLPAWCADADWIRPVSEAEFYAHLVDIALLASGRQVAQLIGRAEAPGPDGPVAPSPIEALGPPEAASNGWAVGREVSASGHGMVLANPHFPWFGEARFWECHLTVPGDLDVYGGCLLGVPGVQIGFNRSVAWTHTFSIGSRFTAYRLDLVPGTPTAYRYGDEVREMTSERHSVRVRADDGTTATVERTLWSTHHGPMLNLPLIGWGNELGFAYRDANIDNTRMLSQYLRMDRARDLDDLRSAFAEEQGTAWINTMATDASGRVWYCDASATPRLSTTAQARFRSRVRDDFVAALLFKSRVALLDGSDPDDEWLDTPGSRSPGLEPFDALPEIWRDDFVLNANDSYWLANPAEPLTGYTPLCGFDRVGQSLRTRQNLRTAQALAHRGAVTRADLLGAVFANASLSAQLLRAEVVRRCQGGGSIVVEGHETDLDAVAAVLDAWDGTYDLHAIGALLWREILISFGDEALRDAGALFATPFDPEDPVATPNGLAAPLGADDQVLHAVGHAARVLASAGIDIAAPLGEHQWTMRGQERLAVHGGGEVEGVLNVLTPVNVMPNHALEPTPAKPIAVPGRERSGLGAGGYQCDYGASLLFAVEMTPDGPVGEGLLVYGQCIDGRSPHHDDQVRLFASKRVRPLRFDAADVDAHTERIEHVTNR